MANELQTHKNHANIKRRTKILKYIFHIEDSVFYNLKLIFKKNEYNLEEIKNFIDPNKSIEHFKLMMDNDSRYNIVLKHCFKNETFKVDSFFESATFTNLLNMIDIFNQNIKRKVLPFDITFKENKKNLKKIIVLRNKMSHSSLENVDDIIVSLLPISDNDNNRAQYEELINFYLKSYGINISNVSFVL